MSRRAPPPVDASLRSQAVFTHRHADRVAWRMRLRLPAPVLLVMPSFLLATFIISYPLLQLGNIAVHQVNRFGQMRNFVGIENFSSVLADPLFAESLIRTLEWTLGVVGGTVLIAAPVALILNARFIGRSLARALVMLPWAVSLTMTAVVWRWALNGQSGLFNLTLQELGLIRQPIVWLASGGTAFPAEIIIGILVSIPFCTTVYLGGLSSIPPEIYEAAAIEGASGWQQFRTLTLPLMRPFINIALVLNIIYVFNSFPIIWVMTQGGPANSTDILVTYLYKLAFVFGRLGDAAAVSLLMFAILLVFTLLYLRLALKGAHDD